MQYKSPTPETFSLHLPAVFVSLIRHYLTSSICGQTGCGLSKHYPIVLSDERPVKVTVSSNLIPPSPREMDLANVYNAHGLGPGQNSTIDES